MSNEAQQRWDLRYREGDLPWDTGEPAPELVTRLPGLGLVPGSAALEVGAGTGTNAVWMALQGLEVTAVDISATAAERARARAQAAGAQLRFEVQDWLVEPPVPAGSQALVFDRGCFHVHDAAGRSRFAEQAHHVLAPDGAWLSLAGNADEESLGRGPPRVSVADIAAAVEPWFEVQELRAVRFHGQVGALAWLGLYRRRRPERPGFTHD